MQNAQGELCQALRRRQSPKMRIHSQRYSFVGLVSLLFKVLMALSLLHKHDHLLTVFETTLFIVLMMISNLSFRNAYCHYLKRYDSFNAEATVAWDHMDPTFAPVLQVSFPNSHLLSIDQLLMPLCSKITYEVQTLSCFWSKIIYHNSAFAFFLALYQLQCMILVVSKLQSFASKKLNNAYEFGKPIPAVDKTVDESWFKSMPNEKLANSKGT